MIITSVAFLGQMSTTNRGPLTIRQKRFFNSATRRVTGTLQRTRVFYRVGQLSMVVVTTRGLVNALTQRGSLCLLQDRVYRRVRYCHEKIQRQFIRVVLGRKDGIGVLLNNCFFKGVLSIFILYGFLYVK